MIYSTIYQILYQLAEVQTVVPTWQRMKYQYSLAKGHDISRWFIVSCSWSHKRHRSGLGKHDALADQLSNIYHELEAIEKTCTFQESNFSRFVPMAQTELLLEKDTHMLILLNIYLRMKRAICVCLLR
jgi:hypothetical protein